MVEMLTQGPLSLSDFLDKLSFWHSFLPMPSSDYDVRSRFMNGLRDDIFNSVTRRGFSSTKHSFLRLTNEARHVESTIEDSKAARDHRDLLHHRLARASNRVKICQTMARPWFSLVVDVGLVLVPVPFHDPLSVIIQIVSRRPMSKTLNIKHLPNLIPPVLRHVTTMP
jgi:hypothetical protein